jgi:hypothetical protein
MNVSILFHVLSVLQINLYVLAQLIGADGNAILVTRALLCSPVMRADPLTTRVPLDLIQQPQNCQVSKYTGC